MGPRRCTGWLGEPSGLWDLGELTSRMLTGGEDPLYIARRLVVVASEDVGLGDPHGLPLVSGLR